MDHDYIERLNLVDQYLLGKLAAEESSSFEEHFVDCPLCVDRLTVTRGFRQDLRLLAVEEAAKLKPHQGRSALPFQSKVTGRGWWTLAACGLATAVAIGAFFVVRETQGLRAEVNDAKSVIAQLERRYEQERESASMSEAQRQERERDLTAQISELEAQIQGAQSAKPGAGMPVINPPIFGLQSVRGGGQTSSGLVNEIALSRSRGSFIITIPLEGELQYEDYRISIFDNKDRRIWRRGGFKANSYGSLAALFDSKFLMPGDYIIQVDGIMKNGNVSAIGKYPVVIRTR